MAGAGTNIVKLEVDSNKFEKGIKQAQKQWNDFTRSIGLNIGKFSAIAVAAGTVTTALKVAKDAFMASEAAVDEWGRQTESAKSLYQGFLNALNNGDISGYLRNIDSIVTAARKAYDEMDRLGTMRTIQAPQISGQQAENARLRTMIRTGRYVAPLEGTGEAGMVNGQQLTPEQIRSYESQLETGINKVVDLMTNEVRQQTSAIDAAYESMATDMRMSLEEFRKGTSSMAVFEDMVAGAKKYRQFEYDNTVNNINPMTGIRTSYRVGGENPYQQYSGWDIFRVDGERYNKMVQLIQQRDNQTSNIYNMMGQAYQTINRAEGTTVRNIMTGSSPTGGTTTAVKEVYAPLAGSIDAQVAKVKELQDAFNAAGSDGIRMGLLPQLKEAEQTLERMKNQSSMWLDPNSISLPSVGLPEIKMPEIDDSALEKQRALARLAEINQKEWNAAANAIGAVGEALQNIEDPAVKVAGTIAQAIANIALSFAQAMTVAAETSGPWGWLAFAATGTATMISTIAAIKQATAGSYANGGVIGGTHFSGDMQLARVNAGETILNQAQAGTLAARLQNDNALSNLHLETRIKGEDLIVALNNTGRRTLVGEFVTTNRRRGI